MRAQWRGRKRRDDDRGGERRDDDGHRRKRHESAGLPSPLCGRDDCSLDAKRSARPPRTEADLPRRRPYTAWEPHRSSDAPPRSPLRSPRWLPALAPHPLPLAVRWGGIAEQRRGRPRGGLPPRDRGRSPSRRRGRDRSRDRSRRRSRSRSRRRPLSLVVGGRWQAAQLQGVPHEYPGASGQDDHQGQGPH